jgi:hypothetical protein
MDLLSNGTGIAPMIHDVLPEAPHWPEKAEDWRAATNLTVSASLEN